MSLFYFILNLAYRFALFNQFISNRGWIELQKLCKKANTTDDELNNQSCE